MSSSNDSTREQALQFHSNADGVFYDTTYCVGPFFLSMLSCRHPCLKNNKTVLIAGLIHTFTQQMDHEPLFSKIRKLIEHFNSKKTVVVTDREGSIRNAIAQECPNLINVFCWNHIRQVRFEFF